ncbi:MAG: efflux RND transporter periplasmic adaptor subunit [Spirochaetaceae bacterium]|jgi:multidrug efflux pump subunit AcrA (membrane-fusion protein)|nr:efflux RND transporter periplasmic adaptor subunit [Spirochaetaceae bacterium]
MENLEKNEKNEKDGKKRKIGTKIVTLILIGLCVVFAGLIGFSYLGKKSPSGAPQTAAVPGGGAPPPGAPPAAQPSASGAGGGQASGSRPAGNAQPSASGADGGQASGGRPASGAQPAGGQTPGSGAGRGTAVRVASLTLDTIENKVILNGDVLARTQVSVYPTVAGKVSEIRFSVGDAVKSGDTVAMVDPSRPGDVYSKSPVISPVSGTVLSVPVNTGDTVTAQTAVYVVGDLSSLLVETFIPERFATVARKGLPAEVTLEAVPGETFSAAVEEVSPALDVASRTLKVRLRFTKPDSRIKAGMFATVTLVTRTKQDVLVVPRSALINTYGSWVVFTVKGNAAERRELTLGLESEEVVEVLSGLKPGEQVVIAGQNFLSDGAPIRIVEG